MYISLYGLALAVFLFAGALFARFALLKVLDKAAELNAKTLDAAALAEKLRMRNAVARILTADLVIFPILGYWIGLTFLDPR